MRVHQALNNFDKNLRFTIDILRNVETHFSDLEQSTDGIALFEEPSNTDQYVMAYQDL